MQTSARPVPATYEDLLRATEQGTAELIDGELHVAPRPAMRHARLHSRLLRSLGSGDDGLDDLPGWWIVLEPELHLGSPNPRSLVLVPDVAGWVIERAGGLDDATAIEIVPDWVCEILSPGNRSRDRISKMTRYAACGVRWAWLVDPDERSMEVFELHEGVWRLVQHGVDDEVVAAQPFGKELRLWRWWPATGGP